MYLNIVCCASATAVAYFQAVTIDRSITDLRLSLLRHISVWHAISPKETGGSRWIYVNVILRYESLFEPFIIEVGSPLTTSITWNNKSILAIHKEHRCSPRCTLQDLYCKHRYLTSSLHAATSTRAITINLSTAPATFTTRSLFTIMSLSSDLDKCVHKLSELLFICIKLMCSLHISPSSLHAPVHVYSPVFVIYTSTHTTIHLFIQKANRAVKTMRDYTRISSKRTMHEGEGNIDGGRQCTIR